MSAAGARVALAVLAAWGTFAGALAAQGSGTGASGDTDPPDLGGQSVAPVAETAPEVVRTRDYEVHLSPSGGLPVRWDLLAPGTAGGEAADAGDAARNVGLLDAELSDLALPRPLEIVVPDASALNRAVHRLERFDEDEHVVVRFSSPPMPTGLKLIRTYRIPRRGFETRISLRLVNESDAALDFEGEEAAGLRLGPGLGLTLRTSKGLGSGLYNYVRAVYKTADEVTGSQLDDETPEQVLGAGKIAWGGIHSRYFAAILAPERGTGNGEVEGFDAGRAWLPEELTPGAATVHPLIELSGGSFSLAPGESIERSYVFYFGPKERRILESTGLGLEDLLFLKLWGWLRWLCFLLLSMLTGLQSALQSWGLSIIGLAVVVRLLTFPVAQVGLKQQAAMAAEQARLKPFIAEINEQYRDDASRRSQELMKLYKEHGVNPFAAFKGCLWVFLQVPIFVALFNILGQAFELRGASFLWLRDLSEPDRLFSWGADLPLLGSHFNLLPIVMAATQVVVTELSSVPEADPAESAKQKKFMLGMAILFLFLFYSFPSGLVLYWTVANLGQLAQHRLMVWQQSRKRSENP